MDYDSLSLNERINFRGLLQAWSRVAVGRWQSELQEKVYSKTPRRKRVRRSGKLKTAWWQQSAWAGASGRVQISFLLYGRFLDMGVGKGVDYAERVYARNRKNGERLGRKPVRWYSKRKGYEMHRLRELLTRYHVSIPLAMLENTLTTSVTLDL